MLDYYRLGSLLGLPGDHRRKFALKCQVIERHAVRNSRLDELRERLKHPNLELPFDGKSRAAGDD